MGAVSEPGAGLTDQGATDLAGLGEKVFFPAATDAVKTAEIPACEKIWKQMMAKKVPEDSMTKEDQAMEAYTKCFAKEAPSQS